MATALVQIDEALKREELEERRDAVEFARVNCALEGLHSDEESNQMEDRYARGEISAEELDAYVDRRMQDFIDANT